MDSIFGYKNFRKFIRDSFRSRAKNGFGEATKLATALRVNNTFISQVLRGDKNLSPEQALATAAHFNLNELETEFFLLLTQMDRAGDKTYRAFVEKKIAKLRGDASELVNRVKHDTTISEENQAIYYSDWIYSVIRLSTFLPHLKTVDALADCYRIPIGKVKSVVEFLLQNGLLQLERGELKPGFNSTHLDSQSPWIKAHHSNWRHKALHDISVAGTESLHYSAPMTLSLADAEKVRELLVSSINRVDEILEPSPSEKLYCLCLDWFQVR